MSLVYAYTCLVASAIYTGGEMAPLRSAAEILIIGGIATSIGIIVGNVLAV